VSYLGQADEGFARRRRRQVLAPPCSSCSLRRVKAKPPPPPCNFNTPLDSPKQKLTAMLSFAPDSKSEDSSCLAAEQTRSEIQRISQGRKPNGQLIISLTERAASLQSRCDAARAKAVAPPAVDKMFELQKLCCCIAGGITLQACGLA